MRGDARGEPSPMTADPDSAGRVFVRPVVLWAVAGSVALGVVMTFGYLGAFVDPEGNLEDLPVGVVDLDQPAAVAGQQLAIGAEFVAQITAPENDVRQIEWRTFDSEEAALQAVDEGRVAGVLVVPEDLSADVGANAVAVATGQSPPESPRIRFEHNGGLGLFPDTVALRAADTAVDGLSATVSQQLVDQLVSLGLAVPPADVAAIARPVTLDDVGRPPLTDHAGRGLTPLYTAVMLTLTGFVGMSIVHVVLAHLEGDIRLDVLGREIRLGRARQTPGQLWGTAALAAVALAVAGGIVIPVVIVEVIGAQAGPLPAFLPFSVLSVAAIAFMCLSFLTLFGLLGELPSLLVTTIFGVPSAGGVYPTEALPGFFVVLSTFLPMRFITDGARSLFFFDGRAAAGLGRAYVVLAVWLVGSAAVGALGARWLGRRARPAVSGGGAAPALP
jgi:YhgE/Pip-like protein